MANPQLENGHTRIANEILEALGRIYLPPNQWQVLVVIIRKTYGFNKKVDWIANQQIGEATGLVKSTVSRALRSLAAQGIITRSKRNVGFQKDWEKWQRLATQPTTEFKSQVKMRIIRPDGYIGIWKGAIESEYQCMVGRQGYVLEHRLVMARQCDRALEPWEIVHHKDGVHSHNNLDNLELLPGSTEHLSSMAMQKRIKFLEQKLAEQPTVSDKLAIRKPKLAIQPIKVSSPRVTQKKKETKQKKLIYGEFKNVLLTRQEYQELQAKFPGEAADLIEKLSSYLASRGKKYKSHYATILNWYRRDKESGKSKHSRALPETYTAGPQYDDG